MFDLIGFWTTVTAITWLLSLAVMLAICVASENIVFWASRGRVNIEEKLGNFMSKYSLGEYMPTPLAVFVMMASMVLWFVYALSWIAQTLSGDAVPSLVGMVSSVAVATSPVTGYLGVIVVVFGGGALLLRKFFDALFVIKDKLDKLDNK